MSVLGWNRRASLVSKRAVALLTALSFLVIVDLGGVWRGEPLGVAQAEAAEPGAKRRVALFIVPRRRNLAGEAKVLESLMREELGKLKGVLAIGATNDPPAPVSRTVGPLVEAGFRALNDQQADEAERTFRSAVDQLMTYRGPFDRRLFARALKGLGVSSIMIGQASAGEQSISASLNLWPDQQLGEYGWTLDTRTSFREIERQRAEAAGGSVEVTSEPDGAQIYVGGQLRGFAPVDVQDLPPGQHWVEASLDGHQRSGTFVEITEGSSTIAHLDLDPIPDQRAFEAAMSNVARLIRSNRVAAPISNVQRITIADTIVVLQVDKSRGAYVFEGWSRTGNRELTRQSMELAEDASLLANARDALGAIVGVTELSAEDVVALDGPPQTSVVDVGDVYIDPNDPIFRQDGAEATGDPITEKWWFWTIAGGVTAALVVGVVLLFTGDDEGSGPTGNLVLDLNRVP